MQLTVEAKALHRALATVEPAVQPRSSLPVLANVLLRVEGDRLEVRATNLDLTIRTYLKVNSEAEGAITVPAHLLEPLVASLGDSKLSLSLDKQGEKLSIQAGGHKSTLVGIKADDFPLASLQSDEQIVTISAKTLAAALLTVGQAMAHDDIRPTLSGTYIGVEPGKLNLAAADSVKLSIRTINIQYDGEPYEMIIPGKNATAIARLLSHSDETVTWGTVKGQSGQRSSAVFAVDDVSVATRLIEGQFPSYWQSVPREHSTRLSIAVETFARGIKRIMPFGQQNDGQNLDLHLVARGETDGLGELTISGQTADIGEASESLPASIEGTSTKVVLNPKKLLEILQTLPSDEAMFVDMQAPEDTTKWISRPIVFQPSGDDSTLHILMPMLKKTSTQKAK